jgi:rhamnogalacturonyl hydrolase YesR
MHIPALTAALLACSLPSTYAAPKAEKPYSEWLATSFLTKSQPINRHYVSAVLHEGIARAAALHSNSSLLSYVSKAVSSLVSSNGTLIGWDPEYYSLDDIRVGNNLLWWWDREGRKDKKYEVASRRLREQLGRWPRTASGGFWHRKPSYPDQMVCICPLWDR